ncbi:MAG TPA: SWIM zinc finger family protein [Candidatus Nanoarchaeia archaeon]|nr:SWIM zinc finger family protein [Candidatus Nanoarchaeia archaeon]
MYWEYFPRAAPRPKPKPGKARKKFGQTWWGEKWVSVLSEFEHDQRMSRGRAYARADKVKKFKVKKGRIDATVEGSMGDYEVNITFEQFGPKKRAQFIHKVTEVPIIMGRLLNNELPENMDEITGCSIIPSSFESDCSCPDYANPCKHIAAVFYTLADEIDYDPTILFKLKGLEKDELLAKAGVLESADDNKRAVAAKKKPGQGKARKAKMKKKNSARRVAYGR